MRLVFKAYKRKDETWMIYINNDRKVSLAVSPSDGLKPQYKRTKGEQNLIQAAWEVFEKEAMPFLGSTEAHTEVKSICGPFTLLGTDVATIGGQKVGSDGGYIIKDGRYIKCGVWFEVNDNHYEADA